MDLKLIVDCSNGATSHVAANALRRTGAMVYESFNRPNGSNINKDCGSQCTLHLRSFCVQMDVDFGIAFDGDGDRCIFVDNEGCEVDGDELMVIWAIHLKKQGLLVGDTIVSTVMSNAGMETYLNENGIKVIRTDVGDRNVFLEMVRIDAVLGGEQSGHFIYRTDGSTTGDGIRTALHIAQAIKESGRKLSELRADIPRFPQILLNVEVKEKRDLNTIEGLQEAIAKAELEARVLVRYSGTEPLVRILVESEDAVRNTHLAKELSKLFD